MGEGNAGWHRRALLMGLGAAVLGIWVPVQWKVCG